MAECYNTETSAAGEYCEVKLSAAAGPATSPSLGIERGLRRWTFPSMIHIELH